MGLAPVEFTFRVGFDAVLVVVNLKLIIAPVIRVNPEQATVFPAVAADVEHSP